MTAELVPNLMSRTEVLRDLCAAGMRPDAAAAFIEHAQVRGLITWWGMSADGEPVYALRVPILIYSPGGA